MKKINSIFITLAFISSLNQQAYGLFGWFGSSQPAPVIVHLTDAEKLIGAVGVGLLTGGMLVLAVNKANKNDLEKLRDEVHKFEASVVGLAARNAFLERQADNHTQQISDIQTNSIDKAELDKILTQILGNYLKRTEIPEELIGKKDCTLLLLPFMRRDEFTLEQGGTIAASSEPTARPLKPHSSPPQPKPTGPQITSPEESPELTHVTKEDGQFPGEDSALTMSELESSEFGLGSTTAALMTSPQKASPASKDK